MKHALLAVALAATLATPATATPTVTWHDCRTTPDDEIGAQLHDAGAQCAEIEVPVDHRDPKGRKLSIAIARRPATSNRLGTLLVNTGGPGPSRDGVVLLAAGLPPAPAGAPEVAAHYDLVGVDPRFFGRSNPLECGWPTDRYLRSAQFASPDRLSFDRSVRVARDLAARCEPKRNVLPYVSTRDIARDLDMVRAALGERRVSYLGWSYGGYLGAVYLQMFPDHVDRVVLDSTIGPDAQGPALTREAGPATAAALADWARWAARHDEQYNLGRTPDRVLGTVDQINRAAAREPLRVGEYRIDASMVPGLLLTVDDTESSYVELSAQVRVLRDAARRLPVTPTPDQAAKLALYATPEVIPEFGFSAATANQCADRAAVRDPEAYYRDIQAHRAAEPLYGPLTRDITPCAFWPTRPVEPPTSFTTGHPALLVGAAGDPVTPYPGQRAMRHALPGSRMITLDSAFRHGVYLFDANPCVDDSVNGYLLGGALPDADRTCARTSPGRTKPAS
ncbi:alpha/beta hydrolase [Actinokineospora sp. NBRC 105648]|uniref:alpha/beta hydrolase n=1 Tax=Actinokineospora sp. NBRC 105648 TaxID=3032206 RepID=UPI0024A4908B|nr:alpha/beta hydrolase [Actinokineospora sp. NBRC 105648]GLZ41954.1 alpha/beta hydrolase [Actinokineospora sp. NBRC 105648]